MNKLFTLILMNFYYKNAITWALLKHSISYKNLFYLLRFFYFVRINILNQSTLNRDSYDLVWHHQNISCHKTY